MKPHYRPAQEFGNDTSDEMQTYAPAQEFPEPDPERWVPMSSSASQTLEEDQLASLLRPKRRFRYGGRVVAVALFALCGYELWDFIATQWQISPWTGGFYLLVIGALVSVGVGTLLRELFRLRSLDRGQDLRSRIERLQQGDSVGQAVTLCEQIATQAGIEQTPAYQAWLGDLSSAHNDREVLMLFSQQVLSERDRIVRARITKWSGEAAVMVAVSPLASVDMVLILWRNLKMLEEISRLYGIEHGYWSRIRLLKLVIHNIVFAGVSELLTDVSLDLLGADLMAKVSGRMAQGLGAGLMTARLGFRTMELCRPVPLLDKERPKLSTVRRQLFSLLQQKVDGESRE